jgi:hypothetical protein
MAKTNMIEQRGIMGKKREDGGVELLSFSGINPEFYIHRTIIQIQDSLSGMNEKPSEGLILLMLKVRQLEAEMRARDYIPKIDGTFRTKNVKLKSQYDKKKIEELKEVDSDSVYDDDEKDEFIRIPSAINYYKLIDEERIKLKEDSELDDTMRRAYLSLFKYELLCEIIFDENKNPIKAYIKG